MSLEIEAIKITPSQSDLLSENDMNDMYNSAEYYSYVYDKKKVDYDNSVYNYLHRVDEKRFILVMNHAWNSNNRKLIGFSYDTEKAYKNYDNCVSIFIEFTYEEGIYRVHGFYCAKEIYREIVKPQVGTFYNYKMKNTYINDDNIYVLCNTLNEMCDMNTLYKFSKADEDNIVYVNDVELTEEKLSVLYMK